MSKLKKQWTRKYDKLCDSLFVGEYPMHKDSRLVKLSVDDIMFYADKDGDIRGIFIEYFKYDLQKKLKKITKVIFDEPKKKNQKN